MDKIQPFLPLQWPPQPSWEMPSLLRIQGPDLGPFWQRSMGQPHSRQLPPASLPGALYPRVPQSHSKLPWEFVAGVNTIKNLGICGFPKTQDLTGNPNTQRLMQTSTVLPETLLAEIWEQYHVFLDLGDFNQQRSILKKTITLSQLSLPMVQYAPEGKLKRTSNIFLVFIESCLYTGGTGALMQSQVNPNKPCSSANKQFNSIDLNYNIITHQ